MKTQWTLLSVFFFMILGLAAYAQVAPPTNLTAVPGSAIRSVKLTWEYDQTVNSVRFEVWRKEAAISDTTKVFKRIFTTSQKTFTNGNLTANKTYSYFVKAVVSGTASEPSNMVEYMYTPPVITYGKINGFVVKDADNTPIVRAKVQLIPVASTPTTHGGNTVFSCMVLTDSNGFFSARVRTGTYIMYTGAYTFIGEYYDNVLNRADATPIVVAENDSLTFNIGLASVVPPVTFTVSGSVKNADGTAPLMARLSVYKINRTPAPHGDFGHFRAITDSLGNYSFTARENDTVVVFAEPFDRLYKSEFWDAKATFNEADRIAVTANVTGIDFTLELKPVYANGISGVVMDSAGTTPLKGWVYAFEKQENGFYRGRKFTTTDSLTGEYAFTNLKPGQYILLASSRYYMATYFRYDGEPTRNWRNADSVVVDETSLVTGINFNLRPWNHTPGGNSVVFGNVGESAGGAVEGVLTMLQDENGNIVSATVTDPSGYYIFDQLTAGNYTLVTNTSAYSSAQINDIDVSGDLNASEVTVTINPEGVTSVKGSTLAPATFELSQNYPNPFNPSTVIKYSVPAVSNVTLSVYNIIGQKVATLVNEVKQAGTYEVKFDASSLSSGLYIYKLETPGQTITRKMTLLK